MGKDIDERHLDRRVAQRYITEGDFDRKTWKAHLSDLPDLEASSANVEAVMTRGNTVPNDSGEAPAADPTPEASFESESDPAFDD